MGSLHFIGDHYCKETQPFWYVYFVYNCLFSNHNCDSGPFLLVANRCYGHCPQHRLDLDPNFFDEFYALQAGGSSGPRRQVSDAGAVYQPVAQSPPSSHSQDLTHSDIEMDSINRTMSESHEATEH